MNKILQLFDDKYVKKLFRDKVLPLYPDFVDIKKGSPFLIASIALDIYPFSAFTTATNSDIPKNTNIVMRDMIIESTANELILYSLDWE